MRKVKFGIIGTGMIASIHAQAFKQLENAELIMVYDRVQSRAEIFARNYNCKFATDIDMFLASEIEAVIVATPSGLHGEVAIPAAKAGKHILCEKPLEVTAAKAKQIIDACEENQVILSAVFQSRFAKAVEIIKRAMIAGRFGSPVLVSASIRWYRSPEYYSSANWRGMWELDGGGALMNQGIHTVDLMLFFNGDVVEVNGQMTNRLHKNIEVEDTVVGILKFKNGALGILEASTACAPGFPRRVELSGTNGSIVLEDDKITRWQFVTELPEDEVIRRIGGAGDGLQGGAGDPASIGCEGHRRQIFELANAIANKSQVSTPGKEGKRTIEMVCAVYESAKSGKTIKLC